MRHSMRNCDAPHSISPTARPSSTWSKLPTTSCVSHRRQHQHRRQAAAALSHSSTPSSTPFLKTRSRPTPADAAIDYVAYLLDTESEIAEEDAPQMKGQDLIDTFLKQDQGRIQLAELPEEAEEAPHEETDDNEEEYFTETLARIYIKQGRYQKALEIITRLSAKYPKKNAYFGDQIRFLEKLIINSNKIKN